MDTLLKYINIGLSMRNTQVTLSEHDVSPLLTQPYINKGYRQPYKPLQYYLYSFFQFHSETFNVWTHFVALFVFLYKLYWYGQTMDFINDKLTWGYLTFCISAIAYAFFSTFAHLFHSQSEKAHYLCFQLDYMGIGLACYGTTAGLYFFAGTERFYQSSIGYIFIPSYTIYASAVCMLLTYGKMKFCKPYPAVKMVIAVGTSGFATLYGCIPLYYSFYESLYHKDWSYFWNLVFPHLQYIFYFILAGFFYASHIPERFFPGCCDIIGQGHQIFHVFMAYCSCTQFSNLYGIYKTRPANIADLANPGLHNTLIPVIIITLTDLIFIFVLRDYRSRRASEEHCKRK